jgi:single-strand DNA-binding protein
MASVNKVILVGNIGQKPEIKIVGETKVASFSLATSEKYKDRHGNQVEDTEWHAIECWGNQAEIAERWLEKGAKLYVEGKIKTEKWEKEGHKFQRHKIRVSSFTMLGSKDQNQPQAAANAPEPNPYQAAQNAFESTQVPPSKIPDSFYSNESAEDDLPF